MPSIHAEGMRPVSNITLNNLTYSGKNISLVFLMYSFRILSVPGDFEFFSAVMHFSISAEIIDKLRY